MRDLINLLENLVESTGLAGRKSGAVFKNKQGEEIIFNDIKFFPDGGGKYSPDELNAALKDVESQATNIIWQNNRSPRIGGFAIASFNSPQGEIFYGRYLEYIKPSFTDNYVPNQVGDYRFAGKAAEKTQAGLSPQDLLTDKLDLTVAKIINQLASSLGTDNPLYAVAHKIAIGEPLPMTIPKPKDISFSGFRDYFCEILQPIALQKGQYVGNAGEAAEKFLGDSGFSKTLISFDDSKTAGLSDSVLSTRDGKSVLISSKGGKGATASVRNLLEKVESLSETEEGRTFLEQHQEVVDLLYTIKESGQAKSPLRLGVMHNIITEEDADEIIRLKTMRPIDIKNVNKLNLSPNLVKLAQSRNTDNPEETNLYYHLLASVAHKAAEEVNENTNFSNAAAEILNNGALIQVYTIAKETKDSWVLNEFETIYPGSSVKGVYLSASKTYYSTGIKGNFTFKIDRGEGKPKDEEENKTTTMAKTADVANDITDTKRLARMQDREVGNVGREKRKT
jgi:hypothetical protein